MKRAWTAHGRLRSRAGGRPEAIENQGCCGWVHPLAPADRDDPPVFVDALDVEPEEAATPMWFAVADAMSEFILLFAIWSGLWRCAWTAESDTEPASPAQPTDTRRTGEAGAARSTTP